jgi:hypothetical protein
MTTISPPKGTDRPVQESRGRREPGRFRTTPGRLHLLSLVSVGAIVVLLLVSAGALSSRRGAARSVATESGPLLIDVQEMYRALADADATASRQLLAAGQAPVEVRQRYLDDLDRAGRLLARVAERAQSDPDARNATTVIATQLARYAEKVEAGRVNSRFGFPLGAEETRQASKLMRTEILPATLQLYEFAAAELQHDYDRGTSASQMVWIVVIGLATLVILVVTQLYTARHTNRILNVGLVVSSAIVAVLLVWSLVQFDSEQDSLITAQRKGSDAVQVLSSARFLALQAQANANLAVAERGTGQAYRDDFARLMGTLCGSEECRGGLLAYAGELAARTGDASRVAVIQDDATTFWRTANAVTDLDNQGQYTDAVRLALGDQGDASETLDASIAGESDRAQARFDRAADDARSGFGILAVALTLGLLLAAALVLVGLQPRIGEYR